MASKPEPLECPQCGGTSLYKDGLRYLANGSSVQRWLCRNCGYRFTQPHSNNSDTFEHAQKNQTLSLNSPKALPTNRQGSCEAPSGAPIAKKAVQTLAEVESRIEKRAAGATKPDQTTAKGKIVEFLWYLKNNGYSNATVKTYGKILKQLSRLGADLLNPETVKEVIAKQQAWSENTKLHVAKAYNTFLKNCLDVKWKPPRYRKQEKIPFVPTEEEIDQLIAGSGKKLSAFLQLLKETGMRCGEAMRLKWTDVDFKVNVVRVEAEKGSLPRVLPISSRLVAMLENLPKKSMRIWPGTIGSMRLNLQKTRARLARKLNNPRLRRITFHSLRHWKGTMEYHKTKDVIHVQQLLGHKAIKSTMLYINIENAIYAQDKPEEFHVKVAHTLDEACKLLEVGFEYVTDMDGAKIFRKRK